MNSRYVLKPTTPGDDRFIGVYDQDTQHWAAMQGGCIPHTFAELVRLANVGALAERAFGRRPLDAVVVR